MHIQSQGLVCAQYKADNSSEPQTIDVPRLNGTELRFRALRILLAGLPYALQPNSSNEVSLILLPALQPCSCTVVWLSHPVLCHNIQESTGCIRICGGDPHITHQASHYLPPHL